MKTMNFGALILVICNSHLLSAEPNIDSADISNVREKRNLQYDSQSVGNYYSNFNQADNVITTALPSADSDGTANTVNGADGDSVLSHSLDDGSNYYRDAMDNRLVARSVYDPTGNAEDEYVPFDKQTASYMDVRGKKFISFYPLRLNPKRAPSGFLGLRGKKYYDGTKRAPSGFTGMRGKKADYEMDNNIDENYAVGEPSDDADFFELLQKERKLLDDINEIYQMDHDMRSDQAIFVEDAFRAAEKRAPSGFLGMRGKKAAYFGAKRAPSGFLGVRGKREDPVNYSEGSKRGPFSAYLGTRGKKEPMVPDRILHRNELDGLSWPATELLMELSRTPPKRVPSGFMGVRGKKWSGANFDE